MCVTGRCHLKSSTRRPPERIVSHWLRISAQEIHSQHILLMCSWTELRHVDKKRNLAAVTLPSGRICFCRLVVDYLNVACWKQGDCVSAFNRGSFVGSVFFFRNFYFSLLLWALAGLRPVNTADKWRVVVSDWLNRIRRVFPDVDHASLIRCEQRWCGSSHDSLCVRSLLGSLCSVGVGSLPEFTRLFSLVMTMSRFFFSSWLLWLNPVGVSGQEDTAAITVFSQVTKSR